MDDPPRFRYPWKRLRGTAPALDAELQKEVAPGHPLFGCEATAVAKAVDSDAVLFAVSLPDTPWAIVHLTWRGQPETNPAWPHVELLSSLAAIREPPDPSP